MFRLLIAWLLLATPAAAHAIIDFDHAEPGVGLTVDHADYIALWFRTEPDTNMEVRVRRGDEEIPSISAIIGLEIVVSPGAPLTTGTYFVDWREKDEGGLWHTYRFTVR